MTPPAASDPRDTLVRALWQHRFERLLAEMAIGVVYSALSLPLNERGELACALLDPQGRTVAEYGARLRAAALGPAVRAALGQSPPLGPGQVLAVSDPQAGGTDLGTITQIAGITGGDGDLLGYLAISTERGDWAHPPAGPPERQVDLTAESLPLVPAEADDLNTAEALAALPPAVGPRYRGFHGDKPAPSAGPPRTRQDEGWALAPTLLTDAVTHALAQKHRDPIEALADLKAVRGALRTGAGYLRGLDKRHGSSTVRKWMAQQQKASETALREALMKVPSGVYAFADSLDDDGRGAQDLAIRATVHVAHDQRPGSITFDFRESADATTGTVNTVPTVVHAAVRCALLALLPAGVAANDGLDAPVELLLRPGSLLAAGPEQAVAAGASETALRLIDVVVGALSQALPQPIRAASAGTRSWVTLRIPEAQPSLTQGSDAHRQRLYLRDGLAGGVGASPTAGGATARHTPTPSPRAVSSELVEQRLPLRVIRCAVRPDSGGGGIHAGGEGLVRELLLLSDLHVELCGDRRRRPPYGLGGGGPGQIGKDTLIRDGQARQLPAKVRLLLRTGDVLRTESPGGGGYGDAMRAAFFAALLG